LQGEKEADDGRNENGGADQIEFEDSLGNSETFWVVLSLNMQE